MKSKFLSLILPVAAFTLASAGAVGTKVIDSQKSESGIVIGWVHDLSGACATTVECKPEFGQFCTDNNNERAYGMESPNQCTTDLYKLP